MFKNDGRRSEVRKMTGFEWKIIQKNNLYMFNRFLWAGRVRRCNILCLSDWSWWNDRLRFYSIVPLCWMGSEKRCLVGDFRWDSHASHTSVPRIHLSLQLWQDLQEKPGRTHMSDVYRFQQHPLKNNYSTNEPITETDKSIRNNWNFLTFL